MRLGFLPVLLLNLSLLFQGTPSFDSTTNYHLEAFVDNLSPYVGQQVTYTFRLYDIDSPPGSVRYLPNFTGFWLGEQERARSRAEIVNGRQFMVKEQEIRLYPLVDGVVIIEPASYLLPARGNLSLTTEPITLHVRPLPPGAPMAFSGAVGQFIDLRAEVDKTSAVSGEPVEYSLYLTGIGNFEQLAAPLVIFPDGWQVYPASPEIIPAVDNTAFDQKVFRWTIVPRSGEVTLPPVEFVYFDPVLEQYRSLTAQAVGLSVSPDGAGSADSLAAAQGVGSGDSLALRPLNLRTADGDIALYPAMGFWLLWVFPPLLFVFVVTGSALRQRAIPAGTKVARHSRAVQRARKLLQSPERTESYAAVSEVIFTYLEEKMGASVREASAQELETLLIKRGVSAALTGHLLRSLKWAEEGKYAPVGAQDLQTLKRRTVEILARIDKALGK